MKQLLLLVGRAVWYHVIVHNNIMESLEQSEPGVSSHHQPNAPPYRIVPRDEMNQENLRELAEQRLAIILNPTLTFNTVWRFPARAGKKLGGGKGAGHLFTPEVGRGRAAGGTSLVLSVCNEIQPS